MGVVQTAYANGSSTRYIERSLRLQVVCTPTGVKHLHHAATRFDIGVYFESNGHGTVVFSHKALKALRKIDPQTPSQRSALEYLTCLTQLINQTVGDALSDLLLVEALLAQKAWTMPDWHNTYVDLPNLLLAMPVRDRNLFVSTDAERRLLEPKGLQDEIDKLLAKYSDARCFVRKSGTEDVVRVYAEAMSRIECEDLINRVRNMINRV